MNVSLNEVEALAKKATRGAGYPWGLAEDAAKAVRFLCSNGVDGCAALAGTLRVFDGAQLHNRMPRQVDGFWQAETGDACPIALGAALLDRAGLTTGQVQTVGPIVHPILLVPFIAQIALVNGCAMRFHAGSFQVVTDGKFIETLGAISEHADTARVEQEGKLKAPNSHVSRATPDAAVWDVLNAFAHKTYAPATEESRRKGAG
ncbi:DUF3726 domain-containing protein [Marivita hallyeonensis]|uniref:DUF3726 domain-containing protein n=1 Tax=Marivita hallyeonensis TaxID=996342 RepID=A0A1M5X4E3_9RHOB|nr:DUF3726 domain-containing protein [Marivita hallyeonensis]SHH94472.1 Protein of unknown function [Marivita hallyeonensis]